MRTVRPTNGDDRKAMRFDKMHSIADLIGKKIENDSNDRFKLKEVHFIEKPKGMLNFRLVFHDVKLKGAEMTYVTRMTVAEYLVKQLTFM